MERINLKSSSTQQAEDNLYKEFVKSFYSYLPEEYEYIFSEDELRYFVQTTFTHIFQKIEQVSCSFDLEKNLVVICSPNAPFIVDSIKILLSENNYKTDFFIHPVMKITRSEDGKIESFTNSTYQESIICFRLKNKIGSDQLKQLEDSIIRRLRIVHSTNKAWKDILHEIDILSNKILDQEAKEFLKWLQNDHFTFFGYVNYDLKSQKILSTFGDEELWGGNTEIIEILSNCSAETLQFGKLNQISQIHRSNFLDYICVKSYSSSGAVSSISIILGMYSSTLDYQSVKDIPVIRNKLMRVIETADFPVNGYNEKKLKIIIEALPRGALFQMSFDVLYHIAIGCLSAISVGNLKFFKIGNCEHNFAEVIIFMHRDKFTPEVHKKIQHYLQEKLGAKIQKNYVTEVSQDFLFLYSSFISDSCIAFSSASQKTFEEDLSMLTNFWNDNFTIECEKLKSSEGFLQFASTNSNIFHEDYKYGHSPKEAAEDLEIIYNAFSLKNTIFVFQHKDENNFLKIFSNNGKIILSDIMPLLEHLGFRVLEEHSYLLEGLDNYYIQKYKILLKNQVNNIEEVKQSVESALTAIHNQDTLVDNLSKLITYSNLSWRDVDLIRTLSHYMHQTSIGYDHKYVSDVLTKHFQYTKSLIEIFKYKFDPNKHDVKKAAIINQDLKQYLVNVTSSAEDKILRSLLGIVEASVRTNYYQKDSNGKYKRYISIKFNSQNVPGLPLPIPYAEIFVFSRDFEAIHLRGGKVARGGLRWSDRGEDYRVEVLGLMKAQMTKNSVIVPVGSKGGFFTRFHSDGLTKEEYMSKVVNCYQNFLRGLLDITDNIIGSETVHPREVVIYDKKDPYLVVAADKGTATFSDYANEVSREYNFWLGDAFASGGSAGYDHKKMAITAKGAWISVQRHFKEIGIDVQKDNITVVGIGDMSGDVFGNGMLLSNSIKLVAAFNHMHIFIDPNPDPLVSFEERNRLFNLPGSKWSDYSTNLISKGGGVFDRKAKSIILSHEAKELFDIEADEIAPDDFIKFILKAKVDLIWNGGIGTYVKASNEENYSVGDKTNDNLRVNGNQIRAKVIGEGGNLGMTQKGRIEYALNGGKLNTDFIDNSAGVDCSDHEVNIKIALSTAVASNKLDNDKRNSLLAKMTNQVANLVLKDNIDQSLALSIMQHSSIFTVESFCRLINVLESEKLLQRNVEFIPSDEELAQREAIGAKLTRPELAVLLSYSKRSVYNELQNTKLVKDEYFDKWLLEYFPEDMRLVFKDEILSHPLKNEIILTIITNKIVNQLSGPVISSLKRETGAKLCDMVRGFFIVQEIFDIDKLWKDLENVPSTVSIDVMMDIYTDINKVIRRGITWMINNLQHPLNINKSVKKYKEAALNISNMITKNLSGSAMDKFETKYVSYYSAGIETNLAQQCARLEALVSALDIAYISSKTAKDEKLICETYFKVGSEYNIDWIRKACDRLMTESYWQRLSLQSLKDDMYDKQRRLIMKICEDDQIDNLQEWFKKNEPYAQIFKNFVANLKSQENIDISMVIIANKKFEIFIRNL